LKQPNTPSLQFANFRFAPQGLDDEIDFPMVRAAKPATLTRRLKRFAAEGTKDEALFACPTFVFTLVVN
jgi:hypothetical protein